MQIVNVGMLSVRNRDPGRRQITFEWKLTSLIAVLELCELIVDHMKSARKREILELVIEFCRSRLGQYKKVSTKPYTKREIEIYQKVAELNKQGHSSGSSST